MISNAATQMSLSPTFLWGEGGCTQAIYWLVFFLRYVMCINRNKEREKVLNEGIHHHHLCHHY